MELNINKTNNSDILKLVIEEIKKSNKDLEINDYLKIINSNEKVLKILETKVSTFPKNDNNEIIIPKTLDNSILLGLIDAYCIKEDIDIALDDNNYKSSDTEYIPNDIKIYLNEISKIPLLSKEEEYNLAILVKKGDIEAKKKFSESNLKLVVSIARNYLGHGMEFVDLIQEGNLGLLRAVDDFEPSKGYKFSTYATHWINCAIRRAITNKSRGIRIPVNITSDIRKINYVKAEYNKTYARYPSIEEMSMELNMPIEKIKELIQINQEIASLDAPIGEEEDYTLGDTISDDDGYNTERLGINKLLKEDIIGVLDKLTEREAEIIKLRFGLEDGIARTLEEIGKQRNITRSRVRQIEAVALKKLRNPVLNRKLRGYLE